MNETIELAGQWAVVALAWAAALLIVLRLPRAFGRWLSAREITTPWWMTLFLLGLTAVMTLLASFHLDALLALTTREPPARLTPTTALEWAFGFVVHGFAGPVSARAHMQAILLLGAAVLAATVLLYRQRYSIFAMDIVDRRDEEAVPRRVAIMGLSMTLEGEKAERAVAAFGEQVAGLTLDAAARAKIEGFAAWQQNLRVLRHHLGRPLPEPGLLAATWRRLVRSPAAERRRLVMVLPSPQSAPHAGAFVDLARTCAANSGCSDVAFRIWPQAVDYNDLNALRREILAVVRKLQLDAGIAARLDEISIDTTPGMKLVSIAGAAVTFASPLEFTYVETTPPNRVVAFDVRAAFRIPFER